MNKEKSVDGKEGESNARFGIMKKMKDDRSK